MSSVVGSSDLRGISSPVESKLLFWLSLGLKIGAGEIRQSGGVRCGKLANVETIKARINRP